jgi:acetolactate synthase-1/2/3 large subunit
VRQAGFPSAFASFCGLRGERGDILPCGRAFESLDMKHGQTTPQNSRRSGRLEDSTAEPQSHDAASAGGPRINRRDFLAAASAAGVACGTLSDTAKAQTQASAKPAAGPPDEAQLAMEEGVPAGYTAEEAARYFVRQPGSDFMVDVLKGLNIDYLATNPGSSFRGLHESLINHGGNSKPEILTCTHEEQAVALAHGYYKVADKPMAVACHGTVGIQHAAMAVYNAWCDRVPIVVIGGNLADATQRRVGVEWSHSAQDCIHPIRDYIKWDDNPASLQHFAESLVRAYKIALTPPMGPVAIVADGDLQEMDIAGERLSVPSFAPTQPPAGDGNAVEEAAGMLASAELPVIVADRMAHDQAGIDLLVELAELLQAPVVDRAGRTNFPNDHYLYRKGGVITRADVILGLELNDVWGTVNTVRDTVHRESSRLARPDAKVISIGVGDLFLKSNYQNFQRYYGADLSIAGDAQATLPSLIESLRRKMTRRQSAAAAAREQDNRARYADQRQRALQQARYAWTASPVSTARLSMELWQAIEDKDWALVSRTRFPWPHDLWKINRYYQYIGASGGAGVGYGAPAAVGAALAHREHGRLAVNFQPDGDMMYVPGVFWTAAHHRIPLLSVMHNNHAYHQEVMHLQRMAARRQRGVDGSAKVGSTLEDPFIDFASMAKSMGVWAAGPITDPDDLAPVLREAVAVVEQGEPAFVDVVCQPR